MSQDAYPLSSIHIPGPSLFDSELRTPDTEPRSVASPAPSQTRRPHYSNESNLNPNAECRQSTEELPGLARPRASAAQAKLKSFRDGLQQAERARFDGICNTIEQAYERWRISVDSIDLPAFDDELAIRSIELTEHGYEAERLKKLERKAESLDRWADKAVGGAKSTPFAVASVLTDLLPALSGGSRITDPYIKGYIVGSVNAIFDTAGGEALRRAVHDAWWLRVNPEDQTPNLQYNPETKTVHITHHPGEMSAVMQKAVERLDTDIGLANKIGQVGISFQSYTVRNIARTVISPVASILSGKKTASHIDTAVSAFGGVIAGSAAYWALGHFARKNGLAGFSSLLSRRDYLHRLEQLEKTSFAHQVKRGLVRTTKLPINTLTDGTDALQSVFRLENLTAELGPLAGGLAAIALAKTKAAAYAAQRNFSNAGGVAFSQMAGTLVMIPMLVAWQATLIITNHYKKPAANFIHQRFHEPPSRIINSEIGDIGVDAITGPQEHTHIPDMAKAPSNKSREFQDRLRRTQSWPLREEV